MPSRRIRENETGESAGHFRFYARICAVPFSDDAQLGRVVILQETDGFRCRAGGKCRSLGTVCKASSPCSGTDPAALYIPAHCFREFGSEIKTCSALAKKRSLCRQDAGSIIGPRMGTRLSSAAQNDSSGSYRAVHSFLCL